MSCKKKKGLVSSELLFLSRRFQTGALYFLSLVNTPSQAAITFGFPKITFGLLRDLTLLPVLFLCHPAKHCYDILKSA